MEETMPYYDYECPVCGKEFAVRETTEEHAEHPDERCPECDSPCEELELSASRVFLSPTA
jgi:putative FmdB family regulatory protein